MFGAAVRHLVSLPPRGLFKPDSGRSTGTRSPVACAHSWAVDNLYRSLDPVEWFGHDVTLCSERNVTVIPVSMRAWRSGRHASGTSSGQRDRLRLRCIRRSRLRRVGACKIVSSPLKKSIRAASGPCGRITALRSLPESPIRRGRTPCLRPQ